MSRHGYHYWSIHQAKKRSKRRSAKRHSADSAQRSRRLVVEHLEVRCLLSADPWSSGPAGVGGAAPPLLGDYNQNGVGDAADYVVWRKFGTNGESGYDDWTKNFGAPPDAFELNSLPGATKTIYLDFDGHLTQNTRWNEEYKKANIVTPTFDIDGNIGTFSAEEKIFIQTVWKRVSEDFRPFEVNVTTQDPGVDALTNTGDGDETWGIRVVIGGSNADWYLPGGGTTANIGGIAYGSSFNDDKDEPAFVFEDQLGGPSSVADFVSNVTGTSLGLTLDGQVRDYKDGTATPSEWKSTTDKDYNGHGSGPTGWGPIMGVPTSKNLSQWSKGEYWNATNIQDDLAIITTGNGFDYRADDHGDNIISASVLKLDKSGSQFSAEGIIERNTDVDTFSFDVFELGNLVSIDLDPFDTGPNLDILARILNANGVEIYRSNPVDDIVAGSQTFGSSDGGWAAVDSNGNLVEDASGNVIYIRDLPLERGTYYLAVEGTGRPTTYLDPTWHPGPYTHNDPIDEVQLPPDNSDHGYTKYGSLGYYSISGTRKANLVVGVDFDAAGGVTPFNWTLFTGGAQTGVLTNLISETGLQTQIDLSISTSGTTLTTVASGAPITPTTLPNHAFPLTELKGYLTAEAGETLTFVWSGLTPGNAYEVFVFGHASTDFVANQVTITGGQWNGETQQSFTQLVPWDGLVVNDPDTVGSPGGKDLSTLSLYVVADAQGRITIDVTPDLDEGQTAAVAGLAISSTEIGSISGRTWHDMNGNGGGAPDAGEPGLEGWMIYLDENNNGQLDFEGAPAREDITQSSTVSQAINDYTTVKNDINFTESGTITDLDVTINIVHQYDADLNIYLLGPGADPNRPRVLLVKDKGGNGDNFTNTIFDDSADVSINHASAVPPFTGTYRPAEPLSEFNGMNSAGIWTLEVSDDQAGGIGTLISWSLTMDLASSLLPAEPFQITDSNGNYSFTDLQPGLHYVREHITNEQDLDGWVQSWAPSGGVTVDSRSTKVDVRADRTGVNFGNWIPQFIPGSVVGQVWHDIGGDGQQDGGDVGLEDWIVYIDADGDGTRDVASQPTTHAADDLPQAINDFGTVLSTIELPDLGYIVDIDVTIDITHSFMSDLEAFLISPTGRTIELFSGVGGQFNNFVNITLDDSATRSIASIGQQPGDYPYANSRWRPETALSAFFGDETVARDPQTGEIVSGVWTLRLSDTTFADKGTLNSWSISVTTGERFTTTGADGSYSFLGLPAGNYIIREEVQSGWAPTFPSTNPTANFHQVNVTAGGQVQAKFGNEMVAGSGGSLALVADGPFAMGASASEEAFQPVLAESAASPTDGRPPHSSLAPVAFVLPSSWDGHNRHSDDGERTSADAVTATDAAILAMLDSPLDDSRGETADALFNSQEHEYSTLGGKLADRCDQDLDGVDALFELIGA